MNARTLILAILHFREASGYEIRKLSTEGPFSYFVDISYGSIYPTLAKLEAEGLVACRVEQQAGKPERKVYTITAKGHAEMVRSLAEPVQRDKFRSEFLLVAMTAEVSTPETLARAIDERIANLQADLEMLQQQKADCGHSSTAWIVGYGEHVVSHDLAYLRANRDELIALAGRGGSATLAAE